MRSPRERYSVTPFRFPPRPFLSWQLRFLLTLCGREGVGERQSTLEFLECSPPHRRFATALLASDPQVIGQREERCGERGVVSRLALIPCGVHTPSRITIPFFTMVGIEGSAVAAY
jgi:hypothetical protein